MTNVDCDLSVAVTSLRSSLVYRIFRKCNCSHLLTDTKGLGEVVRSLVHLKGINTDF